MNERDIIKYLAGLDPDARDAAFEQINAGVKLLSPDVTTDPRKPMWTPLGEYLEQEIETPPFLVSAGQVVQGEITALIARAGKGKTTLARQRMMRWAAGLPLFDNLYGSQVPVRPLKIGLLENEGVAWDMQNKLDHLLTDAGLNSEQQDVARENLVVWKDGGYSGLKLDKDEDFEELDWNIGIKGDLDVVIMEPFRGLWRGEENDSTQMEAVLDRIVQLATKHQIAVLLSHHERKSGAGEDGEWMSASRGSGVLEGKVAVMEHFRSVKEGELRELSWSKSRYFPERGSIRMRYIEGDHHYELIEETALEQEIKAALAAAGGEWFNLTEIAEEVREGEDRVRKAVNKLLDMPDTLLEQKKKPTRGSGWYYRIAGPDDDEGKLGMK